MFPFDMPIEISLSIFVVIVFSVYVLVIMKVKPSEATSMGGESSRSTQRPAVQSEALHKGAVDSAPRKVRYDQGVPPPQTSKIGVSPHRPTVPQRNVAETRFKEAFSAPRVNKTGLAPDRPTVVQRSVLEAHSEHADDERQYVDEEAQQKKSFFLFGERNFQGCPHKFKFLSTLPKSTPIPEECFGCPDILECIRGKNRSAAPKRDIIATP